MSTVGQSSYDAVIVGARCAGSPLAARLAERGLVGAARRS
jgi:choline dehydrogenase-like flavoprotein